MNIKSIITLLMFCVFAISALAQNWGREQGKDEGYKEWSKRRPALRLGIGSQQALYSEIGFALHQFMYNDLGYVSSTYYTAFEWTSLSNTKSNSLYGVKMGYEINGRTLALGIEGKFQTNKKNKDFFIVPKIGFGFLGVLNFFYGYNISTNNNVFNNVGNHQFSLVINLNKYMLKKIKSIGSAK